MPLLVLLVDGDDNEYVLISERDCVDDVEVDEGHYVIAIAEVDMTDPTRWPLERVLRPE